MQEDIECLIKRRPTKYLFLPHAITLGETVAVHHLNQWYRGIITRIMKKTASVRLGDWGREIRSKFTDIYQLPDAFYLIRCKPFFAALLYNIKPIGESQRWAAKVNQLITLIAEGEEGRMRILRAIPPRFADVEMQLSRPNSISYSS
ncbi:hypothetical protein EAI_12811 [Harpegnathos saltator]|uniref:Tudor domain-containing protein n=1 Tax=Harpegnathos saltator TaxID=610380 RepID=E2C5M0_HARSA|nr:hypothetical protein EAI_12811 [Harpegnathos saltator]